MEEASIGSCPPPPQFNSRTVLKGTTRNFQLLLVLAPPLDKSGTTPEPAVLPGVRATAGRTDEVMFLYVIGPLDQRTR